MTVSQSSYKGRENVYQDSPQLKYIRMLDNWLKSDLYVSFIKHIANSPLVILKESLPHYTNHTCWELNWTKTIYQKMFCIKGS